MQKLNYEMEEKVASRSNSNNKYRRTPSPGPLVPPNETAPSLSPNSPSAAGSGLVVLPALSGRRSAGGGSSTTTPPTSAPRGRSDTATTKSSRHKKPGGGNGAAHNNAVSTVVTRMALACFLVLVVHTLVAAFPSFVIAKFGKGSGGDGNGPVPLYTEPPKHIPTVCAHRGNNDYNNSSPKAATLLTLCVEYGICCSDYDVSFTSDREVVVGTPSDINILFADKIVKTEKKRSRLRGIGASAPTSRKSNAWKREETLQGRRGGGEAAGEVNHFEVHDFTWSEIQQRDPTGLKFVQLRTLVDVAAALKGMGKHVLITLDPKEAQGSSLSLNARLIHRIASVIERQQDIFLVIALEKALVPQLKLDRKAQQLRPVAKKGEATSAPSEDAAEATLQIAYPLLDRDLQDILEPYDRDAFKKAMRMCSQLCPTRGPAWADYIMPSIKFVRSCSTLRYDALRDFGPEFYKTHFGKCLKVHAKGHAPHIAWLVNNVTDFDILPPKYKPQYIVSNNPIHITKFVKGLL